LVPTGCESFGLSLAFLFCLLFDGSGHQSFIGFLCSGSLHFTNISNICVNIDNPLMFVTSLSLIHIPLLRFFGFRWPSANPLILLPSSTCLCIKARWEALGTNHLEQVLIELIIAWRNGVSPYKVWHIPRCNGSNILVHFLII
jgi:hypothetical protein